MNRRQLLTHITQLAPLALLPACARAGDALVKGAAPLVKKTDAEWRARLSPESYHVLFEEGTEPPGSSPLNHEQRTGTYVCAACKQPLFLSAHKFDSGTGWPSFWQPIKGSIGQKRDFLLVLPRTEYHCSRCGGHQGHVFNDGPEPTGLRYCNDGVSLNFIVQSEALPTLVM